MESGGTSGRMRLSLRTAAHSKCVPCDRTSTSRTNGAIWRSSRRESRGVKVQVRLQRGRRPYVPQQRHTRISRQLMLHQPPPPRQHPRGGREALGVYSLRRRHPRPRPRPGPPLPRPPLRHLPLRHRRPRRRPPRPLWIRCWRARGRQPARSRGWIMLSVAKGSNLRLFLIVRRRHRLMSSTDPSAGVVSRLGPRPRPPLSGLRRGSAWPWRSSATMSEHH
jgi:hypothetical protein